MRFKRIVLLAGNWNTTPIVYNFLQEHFDVVKVVIEHPVPRKEFLKRRIRKLGWIRTGGQILFQILVNKPLSFFSKRRIQKILSHYQLQQQTIPDNYIIRVTSVNDADCLQHLKNLNPDLIIVHGTRIISKKTLNSVVAPFINIHAGITPKYRGSHGAYWALYNNDNEHCGVTVHLIDSGIDTGQILAQGNIPLTAEDNFSTYPYLQLAEGLLLLKEVLLKIEEGNMPRVNPELESALWHHPTLWGYLWKRITNGVK